MSVILSRKSSSNLINHVKTHINLQIFLLFIFYIFLNHEINIEFYRKYFLWINNLVINWLSSINFGFIKYLCQKKNGYNRKTFQIIYTSDVITYTYIHIMMKIFAKKIETPSFQDFSTFNSSLPGFSQA